MNNILCHLPNHQKCNNNHRCLVSFTTAFRDLRLECIFYANRFLSVNCLSGSVPETKLVNGQLLAYVVTPYVHTL